MSLIAIIIANDPCPSHSMVPACLESILGDPVLLWQLRALPKTIDRICIITGNDHEKIEKLIANLKSKGEINDKIECFQNSSEIHAMLELSKNIGIDTETQILIFNSTQPLIVNATFQKLTSTTGVLVAEQSDAVPPFVNPVSLPWSVLQSAAKQLLQQSEKSNHADLLNHISKTTKLKPIICDSDDLLHLQTRRDQIKIQHVARTRIVNHWLDSGVGFTDTDSTFIGPRVELAGRGVLIEPQVRLEGKVRVGEGTTIGQGSIIRNSSLGANIEIRPYCVINESAVGDGAKIGPFAHLREGSLLDTNVHVGNFVETKKAQIHSGAKANHLSYLGDCEIGERTNIGAGCITCNYDGYNKHRTIIGKDAFIGSDCQLVAPVTIGDGALLGAGTTLTSDAPPDALIKRRPPATIKDGGAKELRDKLKTAKKQQTEGGK